MSDNLRDRIACVLAGITPNNTPKPEYLEMADAVMVELGTDCVYRYACPHCGDFWFNSSERMQRFALLHGKAHIDD